MVLGPDVSFWGPVLRWVPWIPALGESAISVDHRCATDKRRARSIRRCAEGEQAPSHAVELDTGLPNGRSLPAPSLSQLDGPAVTGESLRS
jgi:hypothetical protein